jgi:hypothetical protein
MGRPGSWIDFKHLGASDSGKTQIWEVVTTVDGGATALGQIRWHGPWRKYAFFAYPNTLFETNCLRDLIAFIDKQMAERKAQR